MRYIREKITISITKKLMFLFLIVIIVPLLVFVALLSYQYYSFFDREIVGVAQRELTQMSERINMEFERISSVSNLYYLDEDLKETVEYYNIHGVLPDNNIQALLQRYRPAFHSTYYDLSILLLDGSVLDNSVTKISNQPIDYKKYPWYTQLEKAPNSILWLSDSMLEEQLNHSSGSNIFLIRQLHSASDWSLIGYLVLSVPETQIRKLYSGYTTESQSIYVMDSQKQIVSYEDNLKIGAHPFSPERSFYDYSGSFLLDTMDSDFLVAYSTVRITQWKVISVNRKLFLLERFYNIRNSFLIILGLYVIATILLSMMLSKDFVKPIQSLYRSMLQVQKGDLSVRMVVKTKDEVGELGQQFNEMLDTIESLLHNFISEQEKKRQAEINALQTQISPHFLYNALASVRYMIYTENREQADEAILAIIHLLKNALSNHQEFITIEQEIEVLQNYIYLQEMACDKPIITHMDLEEEVLECHIIKLILQPIVENAIMHGLKPTKKDWELTIHGRCKNNLIILSITDNGQGFVPPADLLQSKTRAKQGHIGLYNVNERLKLTFGAKYGLEVHSCVGVGTTIVIRIPKLEKKEGYSIDEHTFGR